MKRNIILYFVAALLIILSSLYLISGNQVSEDTEASTSDITCRATDSACLTDAIETVRKKYGISEALVALNKFNDENPNDATSCHVAAHKLGGEAWKKYHDIPEIYKIGSGVCSFGFLHGSITQAFIDLTREKVFEEAPNFCDPLRGENFAAADECDHGIGHATLIRFKDFDDGVTLCTALGVERSVHSCLQGAVMEYSSSFSPEPKLAGELSQKLYKSCLALDNSSNIGACIFAASTPSIRSDGTSGDSSLAWARCLSVPKQYLTKCAEGIGVGAPAVTSWSPKITSAICSSLPNEYPINCLQSAVKIFGTVFLDINRSIEFCVALPSNLKSYCESELPAIKVDIEEYRVARV